MIGLASEHHPGANKQRSPGSATLLLPNKNWMGEVFQQFIS